jgi:hypothetical protein
MSSPAPSLYLSFLTPQERRLLRSTSWDDLSGEISLLRAAASRFLSAVQSSSPGGEMEMNAANLTALGLSFGALAKLVSVHVEGHAPLASIETDLRDGLRLARQDLGLLPPPGSPPPEPLE